MSTFFDFCSKQVVICFSINFLSTKEVKITEAYQCENITELIIIPGMFFLLLYHMDRITMHLFFKMNTLTSLVCLSLLAHSLLVLQGLDCREDLRKYNYEHFVDLILQTTVGVNVFYFWLKTKACKSVSLGFFSLRELVDL